MTDKNYIYSILQYRHSEISGEAINIGALLYWPENNRFIFEYSKNLLRIKIIYDLVSERIIKEYLRTIQQRCNKLSKNDILFWGKDINLDFEDFINKHIYIKDSSSLQFTEPIVSLNYFNDPLIVLNNIINKNYISSEIKKEKKILKEPILLKKYNDILIELGINKIHNIDLKFKKDFIVKNETGNQFKFDYAWQNGSLNLVKPISFDLNDQKTIAEKAYKNFGQFTDLRNEAIENNLRYDLLLAKPQNIDFFKEYDHAIKLLQNLDNVKLILEENITDYSHYTYNQLIKQETN
ncbi:DUF3037 domain-containing protein [Flavobacterium sp. RSP29]|uniref:DUF3037 domain-containing protein n=1 Tax=unclassified Flavobacterium TaxID=196869 RepID=UPI003AAF7469